MKLKSEAKSIANWETITHEDENYKKLLKKYSVMEQPYSKELEDKWQEAIK